MERALLVSVLLGLASMIGRPAAGAELRVIAPNAVKEFISASVPDFERRTGHVVRIDWAGSEAISQRVGRGEQFDVVLNPEPALKRLLHDGHLDPASLRPLARSGIGAAMQSNGADHDVSTEAALTRTLRQAKSIAISSGASGRYMEKLFVRLGVADEIKGKLIQPPSGAQIGELIASGDAEIGFQQVTELRHAPGVRYLGPLPREIQHYTVWGAAVTAEASDRRLAANFIDWLGSESVRHELVQHGLELP
jgi:molybdate transport system substrate-binding protein